MIFRHADASLGAAATGNFPREVPPKVLVVDDTKEVRDCISFFLRSSGYRVIEAEDGLEAQMILLNEHPALVITDLEMPTCDGWDVLTYCHTRHTGMPVMIMSGAALGRRPDIECWATSFLPKPFSIAQFRAEIQRLVPLAA